jgi:integrase
MSRRPSLHLVDDSDTAPRPDPRTRSTAEPKEIIGGLVRIYEPGPNDRSTRWRLTWTDADGKRRDTSATSIESARLRAAQLVLELTTDVGQRLRAPLSAAIAAYVADWDLGPNHGNQQISIFRTWVLPYLGDVAIADQSITKTEQMLKAATDLGRAYETVRHIRRTCVRFRDWCVDHNWMLPDQDPYSRARIPRAIKRKPVIIDGNAPNIIRPDQIPTHDAMAALARAAGAIPMRKFPEGVWWRELEYNLAGYGGLRWGERVALTGKKVDLDEGTILVNEQVIELDRANEDGVRMYLDLPKWCRVRNAWFPDMTPNGYPLHDMLARRIEEVGDNGLLFPVATKPDHWQHRSTANRRVFAVAVAHTPLWRPEHELHDARHLYCSWLLNELKVDIDDVQVLAGHSTVESTKRYLGVRPHAAKRVRERARAAGLSRAVEAGSVERSR